MSLINEYRATEDAIKELQERLSRLNSDDRLKKELEFEGKLRALLAEYGKSMKDIQAILDPQSKAGQVSKKSGKTRTPRVLQTYKNPETGEIIETKGGNHAGLRVWKEKYGAEVVKGWKV